jgi:hypothetical protein
MTILVPLRDSAPETERSELRALRTKLRAWTDDPSRHAGSPLGLVLWRGVRDALDSAIESPTALRQAVAAVDEFERSQGRP